MFRTLDALAATGDALGTLATLADILDVTEGTCDVESELRAVAKLVADRSEAALFSGYVKPTTAGAGDPSATAGRLLRAYREHDLKEMVAAVNDNPRLFVKRPFVGSLTLATLLTYELTRGDDETPLDDRVTDSLGTCPVPMAGAEGILDLILRGLFGHHSPQDVDETPALAVTRQVPANRRLIDRYLKWALGIEATMNNSKTARSIPQCGQVLGATFAPKAALLATMVSETPALRRFRGLDASPGSAYGLWREWLGEISPKGHTHRTIGAFTPDDLATAMRADLDVSVLWRLRGLLSRQPSLSKTEWSDGQDALEGRVDWLIGLAEVLLGVTSAAETFESLEDLVWWKMYGPTGPTAAAQRLYLTTVLFDELDELEIEEASTPEERQQVLIELATEVGEQIGAVLQVGDLAKDELRALRGWIEHLSEVFGVDPGEPPTGFAVTEVGDDLPAWLSHTQWWLKSRAWQPKKDRPAVEEDQPPLPARVPPVVASTEAETTATAPEPLVPDLPVRIVFAGGDEVQARHDATIDESLAERYDGLVIVEWVHIDWSSNWPKDAKRISGFLERGTEALVLMPLVRTGMGEHLRREAGRLDIPRVSCTGRGRGAMTRAIDKAVQVVCQRRTRT